MREVLLLALAAAALAQPQRQEPVGLVVAAADARLLRADNELPLETLTGDLLFEGDVVVAGQAAVSLWHCPAETEYTLAPGGTLTVERSRLRLKAGRFTRTSRLKVCVLPPVDRKKLADVRFYGARPKPSPAPDADRERLRAALDPVDRILAGEPGNTAARVARAAILQRFNQRAEAAAEYRRVSEAWKDIDWPRQLVHEEEGVDRRAGTPAAPVEQPGNTYALVVGISRYPRLSGEQQLQFAHRDAAMFAEHLASPRGGAVPQDRIRLLTDERATTAAVRNSIATFLRDRAGKNDTVILFIAAHGVVDARGAYVVTFDSDMEDLRSTALPMAEVQRLFEEEFAHVGRVLLYVDICRAGTIGTIRRNAIGRFVDMLLAGQTAETFGLLASRPGEVSVEHERFGGGHGAFSYFLLRGLNGEADENRDGQVEAGELVEYVRAKVREATRNQQTPRETGTLPPSAVLVRELGRPGIQLADWKSLDALIAARRGASVPESGLSAEDRLLVSLQDSGQQVILRYLRGEQAPQQRADFELGEQRFRAALELDPGAWAIQSRALFCRGRVRIFDKQYDNAIRILERAARIDPNGAYILNALGIAYLERGQFDRAAPAFRDAIRLAPHWVYPVHNLALTFGEQGDYSAAVRTYRRAMAMAPRAAYLPYNLGLLQQRLNRAGDAETAFRQAIAMAPGEADAYNALGLLKASAGRRKEAEELYRKALALDSRSAPARHNLALLLSGMAPRTAEAVALWRENLADSPDFLPARLGLAEFLGKQGKVSEAIQEYEEVVRLRPDFIGARTALAKLYEQTGRTEEAAAQLREARRLTEESKARGRNEERLR